ncbi:MFS transporter [Hasllibacter sp. MH4015]|uniref:MFS transporter n=1 Tax=Hasllibacter sp. MH4015 TaxID=2854029 RepID=UPI001CD7711D|nr:MFS transporter [Hasllibacter sp. MH4015]
MLPSRPAYAVFAATLACAGLPIYIHAPKFYVDSYGVGLTALAGVLFVLRLFDFVQDPVLGWVASRTRAARGMAVALAGTIMALSMVGLFAVTPPMPPLIWFTVMMIGLFSAFSFLTICMYAEGVGAAQRLGAGGHLSLAAWRETGALLGVCVASIAPFALGFTGAPFASFALGFAVLVGAALWLMRAEWGGGRVEAGAGFGPVLADPLARRLLLIALLNAAPVAVTSTLFLFYVETALQAPGWEGAYLIGFFLMAAASAPVWTRLARRFGSRPMLFAAMTLAVAGFVTVLALGPGDLWAFAAVCIVTGFALGADFALLPAAFAARMEQIAPDASSGFGLWAFVSKATLALAAIALLPALDAAGFNNDGGPTPMSVDVLIYLYAGLPCALKLLAMALLAVTELPRPIGKER